MMPPPRSLKTCATPRHEPVALERAEEAYGDEAGGSTPVHTLPPRTS
jgi:hypothetical protein